MSSLCSQALLALGLVALTMHVSCQAVALQPLPTWTGLWSGPVTCLTILLLSRPYMRSKDPQFLT